MTPLIKKPPKQSSKDSNIDVEKQKLFFIAKVARFCDKCGKPYEIDDVDDETRYMYVNLFTVFGDHEQDAR